ncbi:MAG: hypothetical protein NVS1B4_08620 [Gemmatimonadaceae bacterium]
MMLRLCATFVAAGWVIGSAPTMAAAQSASGWNSEITRELVSRAIERRERQLADTALADYHATAHGFVTFLAQIGRGLVELPKIVKADELAVEVYWRAPNFSKQVIIGRRDTLLLPTDIAYHRDHLGIVQNNFPDVIRIGEGDEVRDVPHPLSRSGLTEYDFSIGDSLRIRTPQRSIDVLELRVRPKDDRAPRIVGSLYLERETAQVVRMAFGFTHAAFLEAGLEDISVVLENSLIEARFWLPTRQEVEIRRTGAWLEFPARGVIRGRWEIGDYVLNIRTPPAFYAGPEIVQFPDDRLRRHPFRGRLLDSLPPDVRVVADADVKRVQDEARALVRGQALARVRSTAFSASGVSDFVRFNRVEGLALGTGITRRFGGGVIGVVGGRWGFADHEAKGRLSLSVLNARDVRLSVHAVRDFREVGDVPEMSAVASGIAAQEFGSDRRDPYDVRAIGATLSLLELGGLRVAVDASYETDDPLTIHATPATRAFAPTVPALRLRGERLGLMVARSAGLAWWGTELAVDGEIHGLRFRPRDASAAGATVVRGAIAVTVERPFGAQRLAIRASAAGVSAAALLPVQELVYLGGATTAPGYDFHSLIARLGATTHAEWRMPVPFPAIPLGRFGTAPAAASLAIYAHVAAIGLTPPGAPPPGVYPSLGVAITPLFELVRIDVARGLHDGRWMFQVDIGRDFWSVF